MKKRLLIANRSEIAIRIIRSAHKLGMLAVVFQSDKEPDALYLKYADEIIPAKYLTEITKEDLKPYILEDLKLPGFDPKGPKTSAARVIVSRANLRALALPSAMMSRTSCGSSR